MMTCIAVDDEPLALEVIRNYVSKTPIVRLMDSFTDAIRAMAFLKSHPVDLIILDIQMPDVSGIQFLQGLKQRPMVIFTTAYAEYAVKGFELEAVDYLLKPIKFERFLNALEKADRLMSLQHAIRAGHEDSFLSVKSGYGTVRIDTRDILFIEGLDDYIKIHFTDGRRPILTLSSLKSILEKLPAERFMRVHRSFIVALKQVKSIRNRNIFLGQVKIPVGDTYHESVQNWLSGS